MLHLSREQILSYRRGVSGLTARLPLSSKSLEKVAEAGLQDSMPRSALLSIHARVASIGPDTWQSPPLVQVWGPRYSVFVIAERDRPVFTLGRLPEASAALRRAEETADRLKAALGEERMDVRDAARLVGLHPNALRYAAPTGQFLIYWDGARQPSIWSVAAPVTRPVDARLELARRHLHSYGPSTPSSFASWAGVRPRAAEAVFRSLSGELLAVRTPIGEASILAFDEPGFRTLNETGSVTRLLPSGDAYYLLQGPDRELLVPNETHRSQLWTSRVWPGAVLHNGEVVGTWRRSQHEVAISAWTELSTGSRETIEQEATTLPIPGLSRAITVAWD